MKKYICEALGTCVLVLFGCGVATITGTLYGVSPIVTPLAFAFAVVAMYCAFGHISGCHINPAVSLAMFLDKRINEKDLLFYIISQLVGAFVGAALLFAFLSTSDIVSQYGINQFGFGANGFGETSQFGINMIGAIVAEVILTFVFVLVVLSATANKKASAYAGIIIGLALALVYFIGIPLTGASVNPARSFGPALMGFIATQDATSLSQLWVFVVAPLVGGALATGFWRLVCAPKKPAPKAAPKPTAKKEEPKKPAAKKPEPKKAETKKAEPKKEDK
ncbi:MAG: aquaporin [Coriobacteriia bacterium]|nr:aquaporin [Coriobacteriia bacterium]